MRKEILSLLLLLCIIIVNIIIINNNNNNNNGSWALQFLEYALYEYEDFCLLLLFTVTSLFGGLLGIVQYTWVTRAKQTKNIIN